MKTWLMRVIAAAILCTIAQDLSPKGSVKQVGRLVCAMVLLCVVLSPVKTLDMAAGSQWLTNYRATLADSRAALAEQGEEIQMAVIGEKYRAYIEDKGAQLGLNCQAQVDCREEGEIYVPDRVQVTGDLSQGDWDGLRRCLEEELGVPPERQEFREEGAPWRSRKANF